MGENLLIELLLGGLIEPRLYGRIYEKEKFILRRDIRRAIKQGHDDKEVTINGSIKRNSYTTIRRVVN